jgi:hypothetical protein
VSNEDQARLIAERVARRLAGDAPVQERSAPIAGNGAERPGEHHRARIINFVSTAPPPRTQPSIGVQLEANIDIFESRAAAPQVAQSPWLAPFAASLGVTSIPEEAPQTALASPQPPSHPSQERFGVEEAAVSELVEFFENEKQCSVDPSGKPCDHCAMCSSRGF